MLQGAPYYSSPVYGHSHYKKFWLKKMETEDNPGGGGSPPEVVASSGGVLLRKKPSYAVNCSSLELKGGPSPARTSITVDESTDKKKPKYSRESSQSSELDYTLSLGLRVGGGISEYRDSDKMELSSDGFSSGEDAAIRRSSLKFLANNSPQEETPSSNQTRTCADCKTIKTPLWRNGPRGPKSLCNACGIRYKKLGKRPANNGGAIYERPSSPPTPPISPSPSKQITKLNKRKKEEEGKSLVHHRKKMKTPAMERLGAARSDGQNGGAIGPSCFQVQSQSESESPRVERSSLGISDLDQENPRRWRAVERAKNGVVRYGKVRTMAKDEEEGAVLLMALKCGVVS